MQLVDIYDVIEEDLQVVQDIFAQTIISYQKSDPNMTMLLNAALGGGKVVRPALAFLSARCFDHKKHKEVVRSFAASAELMHIATLVHDDAIDKTDTRRGKPTINSYYGTEKAVLLGDFMFAKAAELVTNTGNIDVVRLFANTLQTITTGEIKQSFDLLRYDQSIEDYNKRIYGKTASLIVMSAKGGAILCGANAKDIKAISDYALNTGMAFQIVDDILDFTGDETKMGKPIGGDLKGGTITLPTLYYIKDHPDNIIKKAFAENDEAKRQIMISKAVEEIANSGNYIEKSYAQAIKYKNKAIEALKEIPDSKAKNNLIALSEYLIGRNV
ncbi:MAG: polyprenyl synthetase family protein [Chloroflexi bacterium]|nr:polyprenyl synthetase family protein [Chloroflexota bacterium]